MKTIGSIGALMAVLGLFLSSMGTLVAAYGIISDPGRLTYFTLLAVGVLVAIGGVTLTYMAQVVQGGINEYKASEKAKLPTMREAMDKAAVDELSAARLSSMWQQEARNVRKMMQEEGWDGDDE